MRGSEAQEDWWTRTQRPATWLTLLVLQVVALPLVQQVANHRAKRIANSYHVISTGAINGGHTPFQTAGFVPAETAEKDTIVHTVVTTVVQSPVPIPAALPGMWAPTVFSAPSTGTTTTVWNVQFHGVAWTKSKDSRQLISNYLSGCSHRWLRASGFTKWDTTL